MDVHSKHNIGHIVESRMKYNVPAWSLHTHMDHPYMIKEDHKKRNIKYHNNNNDR